MPETPFQKDQYSKNRGNYSQFLKLSCNKCGSLITNYQKDGPGPLLRMYADRCTDTNLAKEFAVDKKLVCPNCGRLLGLGYIYKKETRGAYRLFQNAIHIKPVNFWKNILCSLRSLFRR